MADPITSEVPPTLPSNVATPPAESGVTGTPSTAQPSGGVG